MKEFLREAVTNFAVVASAIAALLSIILAGNGRRSQIPALITTLVVTIVMLTVRRLARRYWSDNPGVCLGTVVVALSISVLTAYRIMSKGGAQ